MTRPAGLFVSGPVSSPRLRIPDFVSRFTLNLGSRILMIVVPPAPRYTKRLINSDGMGATRWI
jgi:hypothetical protein